MPRIQLWAVALMLTLLGIALVVLAHGLSIRLLYSTIGDGIYAIVLGIGVALSAFIGHVVRWLNRGWREPKK